MGLGLGLRLGLGGDGVLGPAINFAALPALPEGRRAAVTASAQAAAATLGVTPQSVVDALVVGRGLASLLPNDGCLRDGSGNLTSQGDPVAEISTWTGTRNIAVQSNASLQPVSGPLSLVAAFEKRMELGNLSAWTEGEGFLVLYPNSLNPEFSPSVPAEVPWYVSTATGGSDVAEVVPFYSDSLAGFYLNFGASNRSARSTSGLDQAQNPPFIYNPRASAGVQTANINATQILSRAVTVGFPTEGKLFSDNVNTRPYNGAISCLVLNPTLYTTTQRAAVREFCRIYYGVTY